MSGWYFWPIWGLWGFLLCNWVVGSQGERGIGLVSLRKCVGDFCWDAAFFAYNWKQRTEQVKTGQVNPDRPLVGPSVDTFVACFVGSP